MAQRHVDAGKIGYESVKNKLLESSRKRYEARLTIYRENPTLCHFCKKHLPYESRDGKYCNVVCGNRSRRRTVVIKDKTVYVSTACNCFCGKSIPLKRKFCSLACSALFRWSKVKSSITLLGFCASVRSVKRYLKERDGCKCQICSTETWMGKPVPLILDHIDGNSGNNFLVNLRLVCGNCDMQLPTYKGRNYGHGRAWRRKRYKDGLSY